MVKTTELILNYTIQVTPSNIHLVKQLAYSSMIDELPDEIELDDEIPIEFTLTGDFSDYALTMAMLFNTQVISKPYFRIIREVKGKGKKNEIPKSI